MIDAKDPKLFVINSKLIKKLSRFSMKNSKHDLYPGYEKKSNWWNI